MQSTLLTQFCPLTKFVPYSLAKLPVAKAMKINFSVEDVSRCESFEKLLVRNDLIPYVSITTPNQFFNTDGGFSNISYDPVKQMI